MFKKSQAVQLYRMAFIHAQYNLNQNKLYNKLFKLFTKATECFQILVDHILDFANFSFIQRGVYLACNDRALAHTCGRDKERYTCPSPFPVNLLYPLMSLPVLHVRNEVPLGPTGTCRQGQ